MGKANRHAGRRISPLFLFNFTVQTISLDPANTSIIRLKDQLDLGTSCDAIKMRSPMLKFGKSWDYFLRIDNEGGYSRTQCFQNMSDAAWTERHFFKFISLLLKFAGRNFDDEEPIKRWFGVNGSRSVMSSLMAVRRLPFKMDSTSHKKVLRQSLWKLHLLW